MSEPWTEHRHLNTKAKFNHAVTVGFVVENDSEEGNLTKDEILHGVMRRLLLLLENPVEFAECCEVYDTYEVPKEKP